MLRKALVKHLEACPSPVDIDRVEKSAIRRKNEIRTLFFMQLDVFESFKTVRTLQVCLLYGLKHESDQCHLHGRLQTLEHE